MHSIWIVLWISSSPIGVDGNGQPVGVIWEDHYSIRSSSTEAREWIQTLRRMGKGFNFLVYQSTLTYTQDLYSEETSNEK